uniref:Protein kinase domain-containing protein n=1 Tax=Heterorhabditis bacteriophora TaxID=37862 RepID=A0A1I7XUF5_HETBA
MDMQAFIVGTSRLVISKQFRLQKEMIVLCFYMCMRIQMTSILVMTTLVEFTRDSEGNHGKVLSNIDGEKINVSKLLRDTNSSYYLYIFKFEYEFTGAGSRVILGKGTYGTVYSARDITTQRQIVVKEIEVKYDEEIEFTVMFRLLLGSTVNGRD